MLGKAAAALGLFSLAGTATWIAATAEPLEAPPQAPAAQAVAKVERAGRPDPRDFVRLFQRRQPGQEYFAVRVGLAGRDGGLCPVWVDVHAVEGDVIVGAVGSSEAPLCGRKYGDPVRVRLDKVEDWIVVGRGATLHGAAVSASGR